MKTLLVVSGGDAPGINTTIAHVAALAAAQGDEVVGAVGGLPGLMDEHLTTLTPAQLIPWSSRAGSYLGTSRDPVLKQAEAGERIRAVLRQHKIANVVLFGGNGSLRYIPPFFAEWGVPCIGIPTTIDNDVPGTEETLGFDSACNFAYHSLDGVLLTAHALAGRLFMVETLGGNTGFIALAVAQGIGAHAVLLPEFEYDVDWLALRLAEAVSAVGHGLLVLSEGAKDARTLADTLPDLTGTRMRDVRIGHAMRGAAPSHRDRVLAAEMARTAREALREGLTTGIVVVREGVILPHEGLLPEETRLPDRALYDQINGL